MTSVDVASAFLIRLRRRADDIDDVWNRRSGLVCTARTRSVGRVTSTVDVGELDNHNRSRLGKYHKLKLETREYYEIMSVMSTRPATDAVGRSRGARMNDTVVAFETIVSDTIASEREALESRELESHHTADINVYTDNLYISSSVTSAY